MLPSPKRPNTRGRHQDEATEYRAEVERAHIAFMRSPPDADALRELAHRAITVFDAIGSDTDLADAWQLMGVAELAAHRRGAQLTALQKGREYAVASGDIRRQIEAWNEVGGAMLFGRTPVQEVLAFLDEELTWAQERGLLALEADALLGGPYLYSRLGEFEEARDRLERSKSICRELGIAYGLAEAHSAGAEMEMLAGRTDAAERELATRSASRRKWERLATSRSTARSSPTSSSRKDARTTQSLNSTRFRIRTTPPRGRQPAPACSHAAVKRGKR